MMCFAGLKRPLNLLTLLLSRSAMGAGQASPFSCNLRDSLGILWSTLVSYMAAQGSMKDPRAPEHSCKNSYNLALEVPKAMFH